jgi:galactonate dehydratase
VFQPDIGRTGLSNGIRQASMATEHGIAVTPHMGNGSPIVQATALHFWAATRPEVPCEYQFDLADVLPAAFKSGWTFAKGRLDVPALPGLGVEVDEVALRASSRAIELWRAA